MNNPVISITQSVSSIDLKPGECITLFLGIGTKRVQVEARVLADGTPELFTDNLQRKPFTEWTPDRTEVST